MFQTLLERIALGLDDAGIPYMVIGGQAVLLYGEPRLTKDIDVTLGLGPDELDRIVSAVRTLDLEMLVDPEKFTRETLVLPCRDRPSGIRVDLILSFSEYEKQAIERAHVIRIEDADVRFATVEDLIVHKVVAGRPRDLEDVRSIVRKNPHFDQAYVERWLAQFSKVVGESLKERFRASVDEQV